MKKIIQRIKSFFAEDVAATSVEYAVMLMLIIGMCITAIQLVGGPVKGFWSNNQNQIEKAVNQGKN